MSKMEKIEELINRIDYKDFFCVLNKEQALEFLADTCDATGEEISEEDLFGEKLADDSIVFYTVPANGEGRAFVGELNADSVAFTASAAYAYAYDESIDLQSDVDDIFLVEGYTI